MNIANGENITEGDVLKIKMKDISKNKNGINSKTFQQGRRPQKILSQTKL